MISTGWCLLRGPLLREFWLDGYPPAAWIDRVLKADLAEEQNSYDDRGWHGTDGLLRLNATAYGLHDGGIAQYQWLNLTADKAILMHGDGTWRTGGRFRVFASPGAYKRPYELTSGKISFQYPADPSGYHVPMRKAARWIVDELIGVGDPDDLYPFSA